MIIDRMMENQCDAFLVQETWLTGDWEKEMRGYLVVHRPHKKEKKRKRGLEKGRVAIILSPYFCQAYEQAGVPKPIRSLQKGIFWEA